MTTSPSVAVTGSTGLLGGETARLLSAAGIPLRLIVRDPARAPCLPGSTAVTAEYGDADAAARALAGVDVLLMVSASESADRRAQHATFIEAARTAGVGHVVYTSFQGAAPDATFTLARDHADAERRLRESGMAWTFLRDSLYLDFMSDLAGEDGTIRGPAGDGRVAAVARSDVARVAATVLADPGAHAGRTYDLTGPESLTLADVARTLSEATGRGIRFVDETLDEAYASRARWNAPAWQVDAWVSTYTAIAAGELSAVSDAVLSLTGRPALSLRDVIAQQQAR